MAGERWPDFFLIGAGKAGTTSIYKVLAGHPAVFLPEVKESHYFCDPGTVYGKEAMPREPYLEMFRAAPPDRRAGDCSTSYFISPGAAARIREVRPDARIVAILRDPVDRAYSDYLMLRRFRVIGSDFLTALREELARIDRDDPAGPFLVRTSLYARNLSPYLEAFGRDRVLVLYTEALRADPAATYRRIAAFLDIDAGGMDRPAMGRTANPYVAERSEALSRVARSPKMERVARWLVPRGARAALRRIRERTLQHRAEKPPMPVEAYDLLLPRLTAEIDSLEEMLGPEVRRLAAGWPTDRP